MQHDRHHTPLVAALTMLALVTGCGGASSASPATSSTPAPATPVPATPSPTPAPTATPAAWTLVGISDSLLGPDPGDSGYEYARMIEADLGVTVSVRWFFYGGSTSAFVLDSVRTNDALREAVSSADVIVFNVPLGALKEICPFDAAAYQPAPGSPEEYRQCATDATAGYAADSEAIMAEIDALRRPDALVRTVSTWLVFHRRFQELGLGDVVVGNFRSFNAALQTAADAHGIPVADAFNAFMGADGTTDPVAAGYVGDDQLHPTAKGHERVAELWRDIGYEPLR